MNLTEKFDAAAAKMDELKAKTEKASQEIKASWDQGIADFKSDMAFNKANVEEIVDDQEAKIDAKIDAKIEKVEEAAEEIKESSLQGAEEYKSDMANLKASLRDIAVDLDDDAAAVEAKKEEKVSEARAKLAAVKAKIEAFVDEIDKADQEELILDLISYAEECQDLADAMTDEAELALKAAAQQIAIYNEQYGE